MVKQTVEGDRPVALEEAADDLKPFPEPLEPAIDVEQVESVRGMLSLLPTRSETELQPTGGEIVDGGGRPSRHDRIPERHRRDEGTELDPIGLTGEPGQRRLDLQRVEMRSARVREMVGSVEPGKPEIVSRPRETPPTLPVQPVLTLDHDCEIQYIVSSRERASRSQPAATDETVIAGRSGYRLR